MFSPSLLQRSDPIRPINSRQSRSIIVSSVWKAPRFATKAPSADKPSSNARKERSRARIRVKTILRGCQSQTSPISVAKERAHPHSTRQRSFPEQRTDESNKVSLFEARVRHGRRKFAARPTDDCERGRRARFTALISLTYAISALSPRVKCTRSSLLETARMHILSRDTLPAGAETDTFAARRDNVVRFRLRTPRVSPRANR